MIDNNILKTISKSVPLYVLRVSDTLISNGFKAYLVGGSVRDLFLKKEPEDYDIATDAVPEQIQELFPKSIATGAKFGTITVLSDDEKGENFEVEVTTFRSESDYFGGRWPGKVEFTKTIEDDLSRRDFTINAIAIDLKDLSDYTRLSSEKIIDPFGGLRDLNNEIIRAVGDPLERFSEDGLRTIRACRFASILHFKIEPKTFESIKKSLHITKLVAIERVRDEFEKIIKNSSIPSVGFRLLKKSGILAIYIPELIETEKIEQPEYHTDNVFEHSLKTMDIAHDSVKWAALFHDIGKVKTKVVDNTGTHFYGHDKVGAEMVKQIMTRLKFSKKEIEKNVNLVRWHMFYYPSGDWRKEFDIKEVNISDEKNNVKFGWTDTAIRRFIKNIGGEENLDDLLKLRIADATSNPKSSFSTKEIEIFQKRVAEVKAKDMALKVSDLDITGYDLQKMGYKTGPKYTIMLEYLLQIVIEDPASNKKEKLIKIIKQTFPKDQ